MDRRLLGWDIAAGKWDGLALQAEEARGLLADLYSEMDSDSTDFSGQSAARLQQYLMGLRRTSFEEVQSEAPFSRFAQKSMKTLFSAWREGAIQFDRAWDGTFCSGWEAEARVQEPPIRIVGESGDSEEKALEVVGAPDRKTEASAELWYLRYRFGLDWKAGMHLSTFNEDGAGFSIHHIELSNGSPRRIYFRLR